MKFIALLREILLQAEGKSPCPLCGETMNAQLLVCDKCNKALLERAAKAKIVHKGSLPSPPAISPVLNKGDRDYE